MAITRRRLSNRNKNGKISKVLPSHPGHCIICDRSWVEAELHPYTSQRRRLFCRRDRRVTEAMRKLDYHRETGYSATTVAAYNQLELINLLDGKLSYERIARAVIWAEYHEMPRP